MTSAPASDATTGAPDARTARPQRRLHLPHRHDGTYVVTSALPGRTADRDLRTRRYVISQAVRLCCFLAAALLPLPMLARLALMAASIVLPWGAVIAANAGPARSRRRINVLPTTELPQAASSAPTADTGTPTARGADTAQKRESAWYRLRWRMSYALLQAYGPAQLSGGNDPRQQMLTERTDHRKGVVEGKPANNARRPVKCRVMEAWISRWAGCSER